jgi:DNA integrity scanning protein DisA with diadenylate cyclase activity
VSDQRTAGYVINIAKKHNAQLFYVYLPRNKQKQQENKFRVCLWKEKESMTMSRVNNSRRLPRSDEDLARMVVSVAKATRVDGIICITETGTLAQHLYRLKGRFRLIATTTNSETYDTLSKAGMEVIRLPLHTADKHTQVRHAISVVLQSSSFSIGDLVICAIGRDVYQDEGNLVVLTEMEPSIENLAVSDLLKFTHGIQPKVLEAVFAVARMIGRAARRGNRVGTIFMLGDSRKVLKGSKQLVPNPFQGHKKANRMLTNHDIHEALVELSKLDGAFVLRGDGFIQTAGVFLTSPPTDTELVSGLGTRHATAAAVTMRTTATAVVVSATDGNVRWFSGGKMILKIDPDIANDHTSMNE